MMQGGGYGIEPLHRLRDSAASEPACQLVCTCCLRPEARRTRTTSKCERAPLASSQFRELLSLFYLTSLLIHVELKPNITILTNIQTNPNTNTTLPTVKMVKAGKSAFVSPSLRPAPPCFPSG